MKPQPKRELAIESAFKNDYQISFYASPDALEDVKSFGNITPWANNNNKYWLHVDRRYDFQEVLAYMENYG